MFAPFEGDEGAGDRVVVEVQAEGLTLASKLVELDHTSGVHSQQELLVRERAGLAKHNQGDHGPIRPGGIPVADRGG